LNADLAANLRSTLNVVGAASLQSTLGVAGVASITNATQSTENNNGALVVSGGVGIAKDLNVGGNLNADLAANLRSTLNVVGAASLQSTLGVAGVASITNDTQSTANNDGALVVSGGVGIAKDLNVGGNLNADLAANLRSTLNVVGAASLQSTLGVAGVASVTNDTQSTTISNGALVISGGVGVAKNLNVGENLDIAATSNLQGAVTMGSTLSVTGATTLNGGLNVESGKFVVLDGTGAIYANGIVHSFSSENSTSTTTGALVLQGGAGIGANLFVGGSINVTENATLGNDVSVAGNGTVTGTLDVTGAVTFSNTLTVAGLVSLTGGMNIESGKFTVEDVSGNVTTQGTFDVTNDLNATATTNGALHVAGGVGIEKDVYVGGIVSLSNDLYVSGNLRVEGNVIYSNVENLVVEDRLITLNRGPNAENPLASESGIEIAEGATVAAFIKTTADRNSFQIKVPSQPNLVYITPLSNRNASALLTESDATQNIASGSLKLDAADSVFTANANVVLGYNNVNVVTLNAGTIDATLNGKSINVIDNNSSALAINASGKSDILKVVSTNGFERVEMSGMLINSKVDLGADNSRNDLSIYSTFYANGYCGTLYFNNLILDTAGENLKVTIKNTAFSATTNVMLTLENFSDPEGAGVPPVVYANRLSDNSGFMLQFAQIYSVLNANIDIKYLLC